MKLAHIIDSMHFVDSKTSPLIQLADVATYLFAHQVSANGPNIISWEPMVQKRWTPEWARLCARKQSVHAHPFN